MRTLRIQSTDFKRTRTMIAITRTQTQNTYIVFINYNCPKIGIKIIIYNLQRYKNQGMTVWNVKIQIRKLLNI